jgi:hypothetical protein
MPAAAWMGSGNLLLRQHWGSTCSCLVQRAAVASCTLGVTVLQIVVLGSVQAGVPRRAAGLDSSAEASAEMHYLLQWFAAEKGW